MGSLIFHLNSTNSRISLMIKPLSPLCLFMNPIKRSNQASKVDHHMDQEIRAPSTAEEFKRVAEQKLRTAEQGGEASKVSDKTCHGSEESTLDEAKVEKVKQRVDHDRDDHED